MRISSLYSVNENIIIETNFAFFQLSKIFRSATRPSGFSRFRIRRRLDSITVFHSKRHFLRKIGYDAGKNWIIFFTQKVVNGQKIVVRLMHSSLRSKSKMACRFALGSMTPTNIYNINYSHTT